SLGDACVDCVPQADIHEIVRADVTDGGEASFERAFRVELGVVSLFDRKPEYAVIEPFVVVALQLIRQVNVSVDETGPDGCIAQINDLRAGGYGAVAYGDDLVAGHDNRSAIAKRRARRIKHVRGLQNDRSRAARSRAGARRSIRARGTFSRPGRGRE